MIGAVALTLWSAGSLFAYFVGLSTVPDDLPGATKLFLEAIGWLISTSPVVPILLAGLLWFWALPANLEEVQPGKSDILTPLEVLSYLAVSSARGDKNRKRHRSTYKRGETGEWGPKPLDEAGNEFQRCAQQPETLIRAYGLLNGQGQMEPIPHTFWMANTLDVDGALYANDGTRPHPKPSRFGRTSAIPVFYSHVRIESRGVEATWPRMSPFARLVDRVRVWRDGDRYLEAVGEVEASTPMPAPAEAKHLGPMRDRMREIENILSDGLPRRADQIGICLETAGFPTTAEYAGTLLVLLRAEGRAQDTAGRWSILGAEGVTQPSTDPVAGSKVRPALMLAARAPTGEAKHGGEYISTEVSVDVRNDAPERLSDCTIQILSVGGVIVDLPLNNGGFSLTNGGSRRFHFIGRKFDNWSRPPPHILHTVPPTELPEGQEFEILAELRSSYPHPTKVTLSVRTDATHAYLTVQEQDAR